MSHLVRVVTARACARRLNFVPRYRRSDHRRSRRSPQGGAGVKLYLTPSAQKTMEELSQAVGKTTRRVVTRSRSVGRNPFEGCSLSERTVDTPLLTQDQVRRMDLDEVILVIDARMPIRARRIKYFEDPALMVLHAGQSGSFPYPDKERLRRDRQMSETRETVEKLRLGLHEVRAAGTSLGKASPGAANSLSVAKVKDAAMHTNLTGRIVSSHSAHSPSSLSLFARP